jgi:hypothetical protein
MKALSTFRNLAGGRIPPLTRTALLCGLSLFIGTLLIFRPSAGGHPPAPRLTIGVRLVPPGDPQTENVILLDPSAVYFPARSSNLGAGQAELGQPEDSPFPRTAPVLQFDPGKALGRDSTLQVPRQLVPSASKAIPLDQAEPFTTFGSQQLKPGTVAPRVGFFSVLSISGSEKPYIYGNITHNDIEISNKKGFSEINAPFLSIYELILGVDSLGKASLGAMLRSSGNPELDRAILAWASRVDWVRRLPPGSYRLTVGP